MNNGYYNGFPYFNNSMGMRNSFPINSGFNQMGNIGLGSGIRNSSIGMGARSGGLLSSLFGGSRSASAGIGAASSATKGFSFTGLLNGASKTLGVINQAIPVVYQVRPIWNNAKTMFRVAKELNSNDSRSNTSSSKTFDVNEKNIINDVTTDDVKSSKVISNTNEPQFFI